MEKQGVEKVKKKKNSNGLITNKIKKNLNGMGFTCALKQEKDFCHQNLGSEITK